MGGIGRRIVAKVPWAKMRGLIQKLTKAKKGLGARLKCCLARARPWVQPPVQKKEKKEKPRLYCMYVNCPSVNLRDRSQAIWIPALRPAEHEPPSSS
jgi:hypothetical protein